MKHTPEPWHSERHQRFVPYESGGPGGSFEGVNTWFNLIVREDDKAPQLRTPIAEITVSTEADANAARICACVNACAGMEDPARELSELRAQRDELREALQAILKRYRIERPQIAGTDAAEDQARVALARCKKDEHPCNHNKMVETGDRIRVWKCAVCGYTYESNDG